MIIMKRILFACVLAATVFASPVQAYTTSGFYQADDTLQINWVDIVNPSNLVPLSGDDNFLANQDVGFPFPFFGKILLLIRGSPGAEFGSAE